MKTQITTQQTNAKGRTKVSYPKPGFWLAVSVSLVLSILMIVPPAVYGLDISQNPDIAAGKAAFGSATVALNWLDYFPPGTTWNFGSLGPGSGGGVDPITGNAVVGRVGLANWIDGNGYDPHGLGFNVDGNPAPDLAISGPEDFYITFTTPVQQVGFAISTGLGNLSSEIDHLGAVFQISTDTGDFGVLTLVDSGDGYSAWITVKSDTPFQRLTFFEPSGNIEDQYFGNIVTSSTTPEPSSLLLVGSGILGLAGLLRRKLMG